MRFAVILSVAALALALPQRGYDGRGRGGNNYGGDRRGGYGPGGLLGELAGDFGNLVGDAVDGLRDGLRGGRGRGWVTETGEEVDVPVADAVPDDAVVA